MIGEVGFPTTERDMTQPALTGLTMTLLTGSCLLALGGCESPVQPDRPDVQTEDPLPEPDTIAGTLRGFGLKALAGGQAVTLVAHGSDSTTCEAAATGGVIHELPLTAGVMRRVADTYSAGGRVYVRPITTHAFTGRGQLAYSESHRVSSAGGSTLGDFHNEAELFDPVGSVVVEMTPETSIQPGQLRSGDTLRIEISAQGRASLGKQCGQGAAGQVKWRMWGAVLWMET